MMSYHFRPKDNIIIYIIYYILIIIIFSVSVIFLDIFSKNLSGIQFDHFFAHISGSNEPILLIFELSLTN